MNMTIAALLLTCASAIILAVYIREKLRGYTPKAVFIKAAVSFMFMVVAVFGMCYNPGKYSFFITIGLLFGLLGDIWLDLKYVHREKEETEEAYTRAGFKSFALGHICYITAMLLITSDFSRPIFLIIPALLGIAAGFAVVLFGKLMKLEYGKYKTISMIYGAFLFGDMFLAVSLAIMNGFSCRPINFMAIGLVLFAASDLVLSGTYFGEGKERPVDIILNYLTYYPGQFFIAWSIIYSLGGKI